MDNEPLDPLYAVVFADPENGTPDNITQAGCLMLARMGKEAWNAWRSKYPAHVGELYPVVCRNRANFKGHNFAEEAISFEKFVFDHGACFDGAQFGIAQFERAEFGNDASFCDTIFSHSANFKNAKFGDNVKFNGAKFGSNGCFLSTQFGNNASFASAKFTIGPKFSFAKFGDAASFDFTSLGGSADFTEAQFGSNTKFMNVIFGDNVKFCGARFNNHEFSSTQFSYSNFGNDASFKGAQFGKNIHFDGVRFYRNSSFKGAQFGDNANFDGAQFGNNAEFIGINWEELSQLYSTYPDGLEDAKAWAKERNLSPDTFKSVSFAGATFEGWVNFSGRIFTGVTSFGRLTKPVKTIDFLSNGRCVEKELQPKGKTVEFGKAPLFHNCKLHQDSTFDGAIFPPKPSSDPIENDIAARAYRTLKLAFSQHQATHEESPTPRGGNVGCFSCTNAAVITDLA
jgi:Pentapeptide repeats (9 copies)